LPTGYEIVSTSWCTLDTCFYTPILQLRSEDGELDRGHTKSKNLISKVN